jgi:hypothetical protein
VLLGDALFHRGGLGLGPAALAADPGTRGSSLARIPGDIRAVGFAHGAPIAGPQIDGFHQYLLDLAPAAVPGRL